MRQNHGRQISPGEKIQEYPDYKDILKAQRISFKDISEHMTGPLVSFVAHVIIFVFLGSMIVFEAVPERQQIEVDVYEMEIKELDKIPEPPQVEEIEDAEVEMDFDRPDIAAEVDVHLENVVVPSTPIDIVMPNILCMKDSNSAIIIPAAMQNRQKAAMKKAMKQYDGTETEDAVIKSLCWLKDHQNPDGSWGDAAMCRPAFTGWAVLAFLAYGETPSSVRFGKSVLDGIKKLVEYGESPNPVSDGVTL